MYTIFKQKRKELGVTLLKVSIDTGLSIALISKIENRKCPLTRESSEILCSYYGIDFIKPNRLLGISDNGIAIYTELKENHTIIEKKNIQLKEENKKLKDENQYLLSTILRIQSVLDNSLKGDVNK